MKTAGHIVNESMKSISLCVLLVTVSLADKVTKPQKTTCECGWTNSGRIVGGKEARPNQYPWMAALAVRGRPFCGASIVSPWHVLTAAHCAVFAPAGDLRIIVGTHNVVGQNISIPAARIVIHERYIKQKASKHYDIAIVSTAKKIPFEKNIGPLCMPSSPLKLDNQYVRVTGWGRTSDEGKTSEVLREVDLKVLSRKKCSEYWPKLKNKICAFGIKSDSCNGDSGGPLVWLDPSTNRYTQVALVSYGGTCGGPDPSVNTDVSAYIKWINENIDSTKPGTKVCTMTK